MHVNHFIQVAKIFKQSKFRMFTVCKLLRLDSNNFQAILIYKVYGMPDALPGNTCSFLTFLSDSKINASENIGTKLRSVYSIF